MSKPRSVRLFQKGALLLVLAAALGGSPAWAEHLRIIPVPPNVRPQWVQVQNAPGVYYAPNIPTDLYRYRGKYYLYWNGYLYRAKNIKGPYSQVHQIPAFFYRIGPSYFKTYQAQPPGQAPGLLPGPPGQAAAPPAGTVTPLPPAEMPSGTTPVPMAPPKGAPKAM
jgi:hypothetical protein